MALRRAWDALRRVAPAAWLSVPALVAAVALLWTPLSFFLKNPSPVSFDDGYTVALAERIIDRSWLPYVDGCSHRGPLLYWAHAISQYTFGRFEWSSARHLANVLALATVASTWVAAAAARRWVAGGVAALIYVWLSCVYEVSAAFGVGGEHVSTPLTVGALALTSVALLRASRLRSRVALLAAAGCLAALGALAKQTALVSIAPLGLWTLSASLAQRKAGQTRWWLLALALVLGFALPFVVVVLRYALAKNLGTFWYWYYVYNAEVYMAPHRNDSLRTAFDPLFDHRNFAMLALAIAVVSAVCSRIAAFGKSTRNLALLYAEGGFELTVALLCVVTMVGALAPMRFFYHYFVPLFPFAALLAGLGVERALARADGPRWAFFTASAVALACVFGMTLYAHDRLMRGLRESRSKGSWSGVHPEPICQYLDESSRPGAPFFVWGFDGDLYVTCRRAPATRFIYLTMVAGVIPDRTWQAPSTAAVAPHAREQLLADLTETRPDVVLDMPGHLKGVSLTTVPELLGHMKEHYCEMPAIRAKDGRVATPWLRRGTARCP